ncbi:hypothetical protein BCR37DRAFT_122404 [Protomyces lactucae-debilis]|uniref:Secreted protein n=1 Tax=Protomyces lactucae-debilis TaxID=2754530 RepID=A0A1Y2F1L4_PROLT|nr:uncharacterized protein BCR37DRAFT_122404 [Protomyces lactucae-debilis]ORY77782.1 hypothetical protein BCR37DRAFT_122404 [Protomyces lactucae-debilis]
MLRLCAIMHMCYCQAVCVTALNLPSLPRVSDLTSPAVRPHAHRPRATQPSSIYSAAVSSLLISYNYPHSASFESL